MKVTLETKTQIVITLPEEEAILLRELLGKLSDKQVMNYWSDKKKAKEVNYLVDDLFGQLENEV